MNGKRGKEERESEQDRIEKAKQNKLPQQAMNLTKMTCIMLCQPITFIMLSMRDSGVSNVDHLFEHFLC